MTGPETGQPGTPRDASDAFVREVADTYAALLADLHGVGLDYVRRATEISEGRSQADAATLLAVLGYRMERAAAQAEQLGDALARQAWRTSGAPMDCGSCGNLLETYGTDDWRVCDGWPEHNQCHNADPEAEAERRQWQIDWNEYEATIEDHTRFEPADGDLVRLGWGTGSIDGRWARLEDGRCFVYEDPTVSEGRKVQFVVGEMTHQVLELDGMWSELDPGVVAAEAMAEAAGDATYDWDAYYHPELDQPPSLAEDSADQATWVGAWAAGDAEDDGEDLS